MVIKLWRSVWRLGKECHIIVYASNFTEDRSVGIRFGPEETWATTLQGGAFALTEGEEDRFAQEATERFLEEVEEPQAGEKNMRTPFDGIAVKCCIEGESDPCVCSPSEAVLRAYIGGYAPAPMTPEQREWCLEESDSAGEGSYPRAEAEQYSDADLAARVLHAWSDYVNTHF